MIEFSPVATRLDREGGFKEEAAFIDVEGAPVFAVTYTPRETPRLALVVCCSILVEHLTSYRYEVLLARALAARGVAVQRFHYRGTGHSGGEEIEISLESMVTDTLAAASRARELTGVSRLAFLGTRWGALVAAAAARDSESSPLILWEPVADGARYFREMIRGRLVRELKDAKFSGPSTNGWLAEFERVGWADILGYALPKTLYESGRNSRLAPLLTGRRGPVLLTQFGRQEALRPDFAAVKQHLEEGGAPVDVQVIREEPAWFFAGQRLKSAETLVRLTTEWLLDRQSEPVAR